MAANLAPAEAADGALPLSSPAPSLIEVSVVIPCLNEADTLGACIEKAQAGLRASSARGEVIVADNGSTDGSQDIARRKGARVVEVDEKGYGNALRGGIAAARGAFVVMGDADDSYDFLELPKFIEKLRDGYDLAQGCRLPSGGGRIEPGAMPALHRWWGNPMFSAMLRRMFWSRVHDVYCGLRGFRKDFIERLDLRSGGMEFAVEMVVKSSLRDARIAEVPITLHPDGRRTHPPHLKTFRDGWRTLRLFLMNSPRWLFLYPGLSLMGLGIAGYGLALPGVRIHGIRFDAHTLLFSSLAVLVGHQAVTFALLVKTFAIRERLLPPNRRMDAFHRAVTLERAVVASLTVLAAGAVLLVAAVNEWRLTGFGDLNYAHTMRVVVPGVTLAALGFQALLAAFVLSILRTPESAAGRGL